MIYQKTALHSSFLSADDTIHIVRSPSAEIVLTKRAQNLHKRKIGYLAEDWFVANKLTNTNKQDTKSNYHNKEP